MFPFYLHYHLNVLKIPARNWRIILNAPALNDKESRKKFEETTELLFKHNIPVEYIFTGKYSSPTAFKILKKIPNKKNIWIMKIDIDEMHTFSSLKKKENEQLIRNYGVLNEVNEAEMEADLLRILINVLEKEGKDYALSKTIDRVPNGCFLQSLPSYNDSKPVKTLQSLYDTYSFPIQITGLGNAMIEKIPLYRRGKLPTSFGAHILKGEKFPIEFSVNHFKWRPSVVAKLSERIAHYKRKGISWWKESQAFLSMIQKTKGQRVLDDEHCKCDNPELYYPLMKESN